MTRIHNARAFDFIILNFVNDCQALTCKAYVKISTLILGAFLECANWVELERAGKR